MERLLTAGLILACFGYVSAAAKTRDVYFLSGGTVTMGPPSGSATRITNVIWRHGEDLAAEWSMGDPAVEAYRNFKGRTSLNTTTGYLEIRDMTDQEAGTYSVEINNLRLEDRYVVTQVEKPPKPKVWIRPIPDQPDQQEAVCQGDVDKAGPVTYLWDTAEDGSWVTLDQRIQVQNNEMTRRKETFSCKIVSQVATAESKPEPNPFYPKPSGNSALGALAIIPIILVLGLGLGYWKWDYIKNKLCPDGGNVTPASAEDGAGHALKPTEAGNQH